MEQRLELKLAPEAIVINAFYEPGEGWRMLVAMRRQGERFDDGYRETYSHLTTAELADVLLGEVLGNNLAIA